MFPCVGIEPTQIIIRISPKPIAEDRLYVFFYDTSANKGFEPFIK